MLYNILMICGGLFISFLLFHRFPLLKKNTDTKIPHQLSVIIPARNEEKNLGLLLQDLKKQTAPIFEIICVDDDSTDNTSGVATSFGITPISLKNKPTDWTGKAWACQKGAEAACGDLLLFLDADVRLAPQAIDRLMATYEQHHSVISVQPYHQTVKGYEQFSFFFNLIQIAANGMSTFFHTKNAGLFGPVILIDRTAYQAIDGHHAAKSSIVDDLALGEKLKKSGFSFELFMGGKDISFRMYGGGFGDLLRGWTKNYATGAMKTPLLLFLMVFIWITSCISVSISLLESIIQQDSFYLLLSTVLYLLWMLELSRISNKIGRFKKYILLIFPIYLALFLWVFFVSFAKKLFHMNVVWKDRKIKLEK